MSVRLNIGDVVVVNTTASTRKVGEIKYIGGIHKADVMAEYVGIDLIEPIHNGHDGTINNFTYFTSTKGHGYHTKLTNVIRKVLPSELLSQLRDLLRLFNTKHKYIHQLESIITALKAKSSSNALNTIPLKSKISLSFSDFAKQYKGSIDNNCNPKRRKSSSSNIFGTKAHTPVTSMTPITEVDPNKLTLINNNSILDVIKDGFCSRKTSITTNTYTSPKLKIRNNASGSTSYSSTYSKIKRRRQSKSKCTNSSLRSGSTDHGYSLSSTGIHADNDSSEYSDYTDDDIPYSNYTDSDDVVTSDEEYKYHNKTKKHAKISKRIKKSVKKRTTTTSRSTYSISGTSIYKEKTNKKSIKDRRNNNKKVRVNNNKNDNVSRNKNKNQKRIDLSNVELPSKLDHIIPYPNIQQPMQPIYNQHQIRVNARPVSHSVNKQIKPYTHQSPNALPISEPVLLNRPKSTPAIFISPSASKSIHGHLQLNNNKMYTGFNTLSPKHPNTFLLEPPSSPSHTHTHTNTNTNTSSQSRTLTLTQSQTSLFGSGSGFDVSYARSHNKHNSNQSNNSNNSMNNSPLYHNQHTTNTPGRSYYKYNHNRNSNKHHNSHHNSQQSDPVRYYNNNNNNNTYNNNIATTLSSISPSQASQASYKYVDHDITSSQYNSSPQILTPQQELTTFTDYMQQPIAHVNAKSSQRYYKHYNGAVFGHPRLKKSK